jgi:multiple sugar transport system permease protein
MATGTGRIDGLRKAGYGRTLAGTLIVAAYLFPVYWMLATSLKSVRDIFAVPPGLVPSPPTTAPYIEAVAGNGLVLRSILNSFVVSGGVLVFTLLLAAPAAYALARLRLRFASVALLVLLAAQMLPTIVIAGPLFINFSRVGLVDSYAALILADTAVITLPFAVIVLRPFFLSVPRDLEEAAMIDGCSRFGAFVRIVLPLVRPGLVTVGAFAFLFAWGEFVFGLTLLTSEQFQPVTVALNKFIGQFSTRWNNLMAVSTVVALPIIIIFAALQRYIVSGITAGATKE